ncbi:MAG: sugar ABC transporter permease [Trueperaceae bacterium]|nr:MAG: sugar ABC transporter permease [Trueperaceae bacterium]
MQSNRRRLLPYLLLAPSILVLLSLILYPLTFALINSFKFYNLQVGPKPLFFLGWDNYRAVISNTPFWPALKNTLMLSIGGIFVEFWLGLAIALLLNSHVRGMSLFRTLLIMPTTVAPMVVGFMFRYLYTPNHGLFSWTAEKIGLPVPVQGLLGSSKTSLLSIGIADAWEWAPFFAIVLYAGLLAIPQETMDAAKVDGANAVQLFWHIMLPFIRPVAAIVVMIRFMQLFNMFDLVHVLTTGGPGASSRTLSYNLYFEGLVNYNIGLAAAMTWLIVLIASIIINLYIWIVFKDWEW